LMADSMSGRIALGDVVGSYLQHVHAGTDATVTHGFVPIVTDGTVTDGTVADGTVADGREVCKVSEV
jgi:hypothetical protein